MARLILDTGVLVQAVRGKIDLAAFGPGGPECCKYNDCYDWYEYADDERM